MEKKHVSVCESIEFSKAKHWPYQKHKPCENFHIFLLSECEHTERTTRKRKKTQRKQRDELKRFTYFVICFTFRSPPILPVFIFIMTNVFICVLLNHDKNVFRCEHWTRPLFLIATVAVDDVFWSMFISPTFFCPDLERIGLNKCVCVCMCSLTMVFIFTYSLYGLTRIV